MRGGFIGHGFNHGSVADGKAKIRDRVTADIEDITRIAHAILKREWERVKRGD